MRKFYYDFPDEDGYAIMEEGGGNEHGCAFDVACFWVVTQEDAQDAIKLLHELQKGKA